MKQKKRICIYARKSVVLKKGDTLNMQEEKCRRRIMQKYGDEYGVDIICFTDEKSGKNMDRVAMQEMLNMVEADLVDAIYVYKQDRLGRNAEDLLAFFKLMEKHKVEVCCVEDNFEFNPQNAKDIMTKIWIFFLSLMAEMERENIRHRVADATDRLSRLGFWLGGNAPYGFCAVRKENLDTNIGAKTYCVLEPTNEIEVVKQIYEIYLNEAVSYADVAEKINDLGYKPTFAKSFDQATIAGILSNPTYVKATSTIYDYYLEQGYDVKNISNREQFDGEHGILTYNKCPVSEDGSRQKQVDNSEVIVAIASHKGIIEAEDWLLVQEKIKKRSKSKAKLNTRHDNALLSAIDFKCSCCGGKMSYFNRESRLKDGTYYHHYRCENKRKRRGKICDVDNISGIELDDEIVKLVFNLKKEIDYVSDYWKDALQRENVNNHTKNIIPTIKKEIENLNKKNSNLVANMSSEIMDEDMLKIIRDAIHSNNAKIKELEEKLVKEEKRIETLHEKTSEIALISSTLENISENEFNKLSMKIKKQIIADIIDCITWDGVKIKVNFKVPKIVCGDDATDTFSFDSALTNVDTFSRNRFLHKRRCCNRL